MRAAPRLAYACTFLLAGSVLLLEVSLTRVFSVLTWHHFTHMILAIGMLGFGAAGSWLAWKGRGGDPPEPERLAGWALAYAISVVLSLLLVTRIVFEPLRIAADPAQLVSLGAYEVALAVPFFFAGLCLAGLVTRYRDHVHGVYFADLLGAACGSLASLACLRAIGAPASVVLAACLGAVAAAALRVLGGRRAGPGYLLALLGIVCALAGAVVRPPYLVYPAPSKELARIANPVVGADAVEWSRWHPIARVDVSRLESGAVPSFGGALSRRFASAQASGHIVFQDGAAPTALLASDGDLARMPFLVGFLQGAPYALRSGADALVIGIGGGIDVLIALHGGARRVTGVELNPLMLDLVAREYADRTGRVLLRPEVVLHEAEGRHFLSRDRGRYDVIQLSGVDTYTALSTGAYALAENTLYTVEAVAAMRDHLAPDGVLSFSRFLFQPPRETLRLACTMAEALERGGAERPWEHVAIVRARLWADTMMKASPFTRDEIDRLGAWAAENGFSILFDPFERRGTEFDAALRASPAEREAFYRSYVYQVRPTTDDAPFFFNYYKWGDFFARRESQGGYRTSDFPLALRTMAWSLAQIVVLAVVGILAPLRGGRVPAGRGRAGALAYFAALGLGFLLVEIAVVQKLMFFLGGPTYALAVALSAMLGFSGLGSLWARRLADRAEAALPRLAAAVAVLVVALGFALDAVPPRALGLGWPLRVALSVAMIAPAAFALGMPFPLGIDLVSRRSPAWVPWAWATNAFMTVLGPLLAVFLAIEVGFRAVFLVAAAVYAAGFFAMRRAAEVSRLPR